ncbi:hypothetical protein [Streptomyces sp. 3213.3]|uniref:hypothetical protein n=1 Tax=Streptomyces sp. 3213.3 TaxID=1855348 RepID=UPI000B82ACAB|nr:hypothetical protein [Streptomyces sp. 3213.3]
MEAELPHLRANRVQPMGGLTDSFVVMSNALRDVYVRALQTAEGSDPLSQPARAGLQASAMKFSGPHAQSDGEERGELPSAGVSWAEIGAVELVRALPEGPHDEESMDSLFSASPVVRRAVADLIFGMPNQDLDISLAMKRGTGERIVSSLPVGQPESLRERLNIIREEREIERILTKRSR